MNDRAVFHLAFAVNDLSEAEAFYITHFDARVGRRTLQWLDIFLWGHQLTLHQQPSEVLAADRQGVRHFGAVLAWEAWEKLSTRLRERGERFISAPAVSKIGTPQEQAKLVLADPSHNVIEVKAYRNVQAVFGG
jgi:uncharacterized protein